LLSVFGNDRLFADSHGDGSASLRGRLDQAAAFSVFWEGPALMGENLIWILTRDGRLA
jgi:hypothetical protein